MVVLAVVPLVVVELLVVGEGGRVVALGMGMGEVIGRRERIIIRRGEIGWEVL